MSKKVQKKIKYIFQSSASSAYQTIEALCIQSVPSKEKKAFEAENEQFNAAFLALEEQLNAFQKNIDSISLASLVLKWARAIATDAVYGERYVHQMIELIEAGLVKLEKGSLNPYTPSNYGADEHQKVVSAIRNYELWPIPKREDYVCFYNEFSNWLSELTFGYIPSAYDMDRDLSSRRKLPFDTYIRLINELDLRERVLAKLFYLGGERTLDEILSLKINALDFAKNRIAFPDHTIEYPEHVFHDLRKYLQKRSSGYIFISREGDKINNTVPYRALKTVAEKLNLGSSFTFKDLVKDS